MSVVEALRDGLKVLEDEILRVAELASRSDDQAAQDNYWQLARDLQREAREVRLQIARMDRGSESAEGSGQAPAFHLRIAADFRCVK